MANTLPTSVKQRMKASGGPAPVALLEVMTVNGNVYFWSDALLAAQTILVTRADIDPSHGTYIGGSGPVPPVTATFLPWIIKAPVLTQYKSTQASTFSVSIQNLTGNTVQRDASQIFSQEEFYGALIYLRLWRIDCEYSLLDFQGSVTKVLCNADGDSMDISGEGSFNWAKVVAPVVQIGASCGNSYNPVGAFSECGAFPGSTPCDNSYGTCQQINRFKGIITQWSGAQIDYNQVVQPIPLRLYNPVGKV